MATATLQPLIRHIRRLAGAQSADDLSDPHLLARFAADRDEAAFAALVQRHGPLVLGVCRRVLGDWHAAEDAFQEVFVLLAQKAGSLRQPERLGAWLHGVAHRTALKARARAARRAACERAAAAPGALEPPDAVERRELRLVLDDAVARLPEKHRLPFVLHYLQGEAVDAVAGRLGWPRGTVATRLARARAQLRKGLTRQGVTLSTAGLAALCAETVSAIVPARVVAEIVRRVMHGVTGTALIQGGLNAMVSLKWKSLIAAVLLAVAGSVGAGLLSASGREERPAAPVAAAPRKGEEKRGRADDIEEQIYRALREHGRWQGGGGYTLFVQRLHGRELLNVEVWKLEAVPAAVGAVSFIARARKATLQLDVARRTVLVSMYRARVQGPDGDGFVEQKVIPVPLPGDGARPSSAPEARKVVEEKYRQYEVHLQVVRVDASGRDFGSHGKGKVVAEPRLMVREGQEALFHCGGEQPVPGLAAGSTEFLQTGLSLRLRAKRLEDGNVRLGATMERAEVEQPAAKNWRLRKTSVECVERIKLGEEVKLVEKDGKGQPLYWALIRVVSEKTVQSRTESREAAPAEGRGPVLPPPYVIGPPDVLQIDSVEGLLTQPVRGPHLVRPDGTVGVGTYGSVYIAGLTIDQARAEIAKVVHARYPKRKTLKDVTEGLSVDVLAYNSKVYYVIIDRAGLGQTVQRFPIIGNETVMDAVAQIQGLAAEASRCRLWIQRRTTKPGAQPQVLQIDWIGITQMGQMATDYQLLPGDRLFIKAVAK